MKRPVICPICKKYITDEYWTGTFGLEEEVIKCDRCGYFYQFAYGYSIEVIGNKCFFESYLDNKNKRIRMEKQYQKTLYTAQRRWRKHKKGTTAKYYPI